MAAQKDAAVHKRQQIEQSSKVMFAWVAGASVVVGFSLVISWFLLQQIVFKEKIVSTKNQTVSTLQANNKAVPALRDNIRALEANTALNSVKASPDEKALQVVLDALPDVNNTLALGASIQQRLVGGVNNLTLESIDVNQSASDNESTPQQGSAVPMPFTMTVSSSDPNAIKEFLVKLESSIRTIGIDSLKFEKSDTRATLTLNAHAYYLPERTIDLSKKTVRPGL